MSFEWLKTGAHFERFVKKTQNKKIYLGAIIIIFCIIFVFYFNPVITPPLCTTRVSITTIYVTNCVKQIPFLEADSSTATQGIPLVL